MLISSGLEGRALNPDAGRGSQCSVLVAIPEGDPRGLMVVMEAGLEGNDTKLVVSLRTKLMMAETGWSSSYSVKIQH